MPKFNLSIRLLKKPMIYKPDSNVRLFLLKTTRLESVDRAVQISGYFTDDWGAYVRHLDAGWHEVGKRNTQKPELQNLNQTTGSPKHLLLNAGGNA